MKQIINLRISIVFNICKDICENFFFSSKLFHCFPNLFGDVYPVGQNPKGQALFSQSPEDDHLSFWYWCHFGSSCHSWLSDFLLALCFKTVNIWVSLGLSSESGFGAILRNCNWEISHFSQWLLFSPKNSGKGRKGEGRKEGGEGGRGEGRKKTLQQRKVENAQISIKPGSTETTRTSSFQVIFL